MINYAQTAEGLLALGYRAIPVEGKLPLKHKGYRELIGDGIIMPDFGIPDGIAVLCGPISKGFACIDFDLKNGDGVDFFEEYIEVLKDDQPLLYESLVIAKTPSGGYHIYCRITNKHTSTKLAKNEDGKDLIETRGEGGYCLVPPSQNYILKKGDLATIQTLTPGEWDYLIALARGFNEYTKEHETYTPKGGPVEGDTPLNRYDAENPPQKILEELGYRQIRGSATAIHYNRPNARNKNGVDATVYLDQNAIHFWSPVSNAHLPDTDRNYKPSQILVFTKYNGDFSAAARDLAVQYNIAPPVKNSVAEAKPVVPEAVAIQNPIENMAARNVKFRMEAWCQDKNERGVACNEILIEEAKMQFFDLDPTDVVDFIKTYYKENEDFFGIQKENNAARRLRQFVFGTYQFLFNNVTMDLEIVDKRNGKSTGFNENSMFNILREQGFKVSMQEVRSLMWDPRHQTLVDPFAEYFESIKNHRPSRLNAIEALAGYVVVEDEYKDFWHSMFRKSLIRSVANAIGDYANREAIVLCQPSEKAGKTSFVKFLNPWGESKYFCDEVIINHKDQMFRIAQNFIYLIDEIGSERYNGKTMDSLKHILSKTVVNERNHYDVKVTKLKRRVNFWGTTNIPYLTPGENSRWISIPIKSINHNYRNYITGVQEIEINDVWKEAYDAYIAGEVFEITAKEREIQNRLNKEWIAGNEAFSLVETYCQHGKDSEFDWMSPARIMERLDTYNSVLLRRVKEADIIQALRSKHYDERKKDGLRQFLVKI